MPVLASLFHFFCQSTIVIGTKSSGSEKDWQKLAKVFNKLQVFRVYGLKVLIYLVSMLILKKY